MSRKKAEQTFHDKEVEKIAIKLEKQGFNVKADLPNYKKPPTFGCGEEKYKPDIWAKKGGKKVIIEVETPSSVKSDQDQRTCFQKSANRSKNTTFEWSTVKKE